LASGLVEFLEGEVERVLWAHCDVAVYLHLVTWWGFDNESLENRGQHWRERGEEGDKYVSKEKEGLHLSIFTDFQFCHRELETQTEPRRNEEEIRSEIRITNTRGG
jgi:hypothetical protein